MSRLWVGCAALVFGLAQVGSASGSELSGMPQDGWTVWSVEGNQQGDGPCCYEFDGTRPHSRGCSLDRKGHSRRHRDQAGIRFGEAQGLVIFALREGGATTQVHAFSGDCPVKLDAEPTRLSSVSSAQSLAFLDAQLDTRPSSRMRDGVIMAMAHHRDGRATERLARRTGTGQPEETRKQSLFWLAQARGAEGLPAVQEVALRGDDLDVRKHAVFALAQSDEASTVPLLTGIVRDRAQPGELRGETLFWLAQSHATPARPLIEEVLRGDPGEELLEKAVFAMSQLEEGSDEGLIAILEGDYSRAAKKKALFWLGQSGSDTALRALDRLLSAEARR